MKLHLFKNQVTQIFTDVKQLHDYYNLFLNLPHPNDITS